MGEFLSGSPEKKEEGNHAYDFIKGNYGQTGADAFSGGTNMLGNILGIGGDPAAGAAALDNYWKSAGGQFQLDQGLDGLTSKYAALGLSKSGAAMKGMETFRQGLASTYLNNYLGHVSDYSKLGLGAGGLVSSAGQYGKGTGATKGYGDLIGTLFSLAAG